LRAGTHRWSRPVLAAQIASRLPDRQGQAITNFSKALAPAASDIAHQILNNSWQFDGLSVDNAW